MDINRIYGFIQTLANKEQKGFISPEQFNLLISEAQLDVARKYLNIYLQLSATSDNPFAKSTLLPKELLPFLKTTTIASISGTYPMPTDYWHWVGLSYVYQDKTIDLPLLDEKKYRKRLGSTLTAPTNQFPVAVLYANGFRVAPEIPGFELSYLRLPAVPVWNYLVSGDEPIYTSIGSVNLELPEDRHLEVCMRVLQWVGVNISEQLLTEYSISTKEQLP